MDHQCSQAEYVANATLADLIDVQAVQTTMDAFFALTNIGIGIIDLQGQILVSTGWQDICLNFHRLNLESCRNCRESDTELTAGVQPGEYKEYRCKNGMRDIATPIFVEGKHLGNVFLGQFLLEDETPDYDCFRAAARQYGFDEAEYLAALERVPRWSRETVTRTMDFYQNFANLILSLSTSKRNLERLVNARTQELTAANEELTALNDELEHRVREIEEKNLLMARSNADLEQFAYVASHDLQEPLRQIVSFTQLLARRYSGKLDSDADDFIRYTVDGTKRMQELINDILAYSRLRKSNDQFGSVDCEALFAEVIQSLQSVIENTDAEIVHEKLPTVAGDRTQLAQLFRNLVGNAIKFRGSAAPRINVTATKQQQHWLFAVSDNGIGIAPEYFERIFVVFRRLHAAAEYPGTGIGLSICKRIVENHGGQIWLESEPGKGSTFFFTLKEKGESL
jgi:signal transduction histidine kinase